MHHPLIRKLAFVGVVAAFTIPGLIAAEPGQKAPLWSLEPVVRPETPKALTQSGNPIDAFIAEKYQEQGLKPIGAADKLTLLRRVYLDLIGLPPTPAEQDAFLGDQSPDAYEKVVDRLLDSEQYGVRYARHWLDVLRYADADERMYAAPGIYLWRDWMIHALNEDLPYDQFVRTQLTGYRDTERTQISAIGLRSKKEPRVHDMFALGFLARGAVVRDNADTKELPLVAAETVSTAFMGVTAGCAKCHDHMYDPISQRDFYRMKALFDPLVIKKVTLATPEQIMKQGWEMDEAAERRAELEAPVEELLAPYRSRLYDDRVAMLPDDVRAVILKSEKQRTPEEQKIADDYFPILRIDLSKIKEVMTPEDTKKYDELQAQIKAEAGEGGGRRRGSAYSAFWTVEVDGKKELEQSYILTSGEPDRPEKDKPVEPGWPFMPDDVDFSEGRIEAFSDWLTAPENPLFARVAVNRLWQWHFGEGIHKAASDFGNLGGEPSNRKLLDWLASEFVADGFSIKQMNKLMVTSDTYKLASSGNKEDMAANQLIDPSNAFLSSFRLLRLEAEPVWDSILYSSNNLDLSVGGPSFNIPSDERAGRRNGSDSEEEAVNRRGAYVVRGFSVNREVTPHFLQSFDVEDGRLPCPMRTRTVTAPQALFMMNSSQVEEGSTLLAERLLIESNGNLNGAIELGYKIVVGRPPSAEEKDYALTYVQGEPARLKGLSWLLLNLDEFMFVQ